MSDDRERWLRAGMIGATDDTKWFWNGRCQSPPLGNLAAQARSKGFTASAHRVGEGLYPLVVRPDPGIPQGWIVLDRWISTTATHIKELGEAVNEYVEARLDTTGDASEQEGASDE